MVLFYDESRGYTQYNIEANWHNFGPDAITDGRHTIYNQKQGDAWVVSVYGKNMRQVLSKGGVYPTEKEGLAKMVKIAHDFDYERERRGIEYDINAITTGKLPKQYTIERETKQFKRLMKKI